MEFGVHDLQSSYEEAKTCYSVIALAVKQEVMQQIDFTPLTKIRQGKDDSPRELYVKMTTAKDNCGLSPSQTVRFTSLVTCNICL